jgi:hypothetical protein
MMCAPFATEARGLVSANARALRIRQREAPNLFGD